MTGKNMEGPAQEAALQKLRNDIADLDATNQQLRRDLVAERMSVLSLIVGIVLVALHSWGSWPDPIAFAIGGITLAFFLLVRAFHAWTRRKFGAARRRQSGNLNIKAR